MMTKKKKKHGTIDNEAINIIVALRKESAQRISQNARIMPSKEYTKRIAEHTHSRACTHTRGYQGPGGATRFAYRRGTGKTHTHTTCPL